MKLTYNHTKIVATMGPACSSRDILRQMFVAGVDVIRLNASHGSHAEHQKMIDLVRTINAEEKVNISLLLDLQGPKIRIGDLKKPIPVKSGETVKINAKLDKQAEDGTLPIQYDTFGKDVEVGQQVLIEDGKTRLRVEGIDEAETVTLTVQSGKEIGSRKGVNLPETKISLPSLTAKDMRDVAIGIRNDLEWIALSFVRTAEDVHLLRRVLRESECKARIIAKIEKPDAIDNIEGIIDASDAIMVARGDLGVEIPIEDVPFEQKRIVKLCNRSSKPVIVATQMLDSMIEHPHPTRAEATDVANAVLDGADAVMLSGETSVGKYPVKTVETMQSIIMKSEQDPLVYNRYLNTDRNSRTYLSDAVCLSAVRLANEIGANAMVAMTSSGYTAVQLSKHRPNANIFIFTNNRSLLATLNLVWGVRAFYYDSYEGTDETIRDVIRKLKDLRHLRPGDLVINLASMPIHARKRTNMLKVTSVE